jgi:hypothetical protein
LYSVSFRSFYFVIFYILPLQYEALLSKRILDLESALREAQAALKNPSECSSAALEGGRRALLDSTVRGVEAYCASRREDRTQQLIDSGESEEKARMLAEREYAEDDKGRVIKCESDLTTAESELLSGVDDVIKEKIKMLHRTFHSSKSLLSARMQSEKEEKEVELIAELKQGEIDRIGVLSEQGISKEQAVSQAKEEYEKALISGNVSISEFMMMKESDIKEKQKQKLVADLNDLKKIQEHTRKILESGLESHRKRDKERLRVALEKKKMQRKADLVLSGETEESAEQSTQLEMEKVSGKSKEKLDREIDRAVSFLKEAEMEIYERKKENLKAENVLAMEGLESFLLFKKNKSRENTLQKLRKLKLRREGQLLASGYSPEESSYLAEEEFGEHSAVAKEELNTSIDKVVLEVENLRIENENGGVETAVKDRKERILKNENDFLNLLESVREKEKREQSEQASSSTAVLQAARDATRRSAETAANHLQNIRNMHEKEQKRLEEIFAAKKTKESALLRKKLTERRNKRKEESLLAGLSESEIEKKMNSDDPETLALNLESENRQLQFLAEFKVRLILFSVFPFFHFSIFVFLSIFIITFQTESNYLGLAEYKYRLEYY